MTHESAAHRIEMVQWRVLVQQSHGITRFSSACVFAICSCELSWHRCSDFTVNKITCCVLPQYTRTEKNLRKIDEIKRLCTRILMPLHISSACRTSLFQKKNVFFSLIPNDVLSWFAKFSFVVFSLSLFWSLYFSHSLEISRCFFSLRTTCDSNNEWRASNVVALISD